MTRDRQSDDSPPLVKATRTSRAFLVGVALVIGLAGPSLTRPRDRVAGGPLVYEPPSEFHASPVTASSAGTTPDKLWLVDLPRAYKPRISLSHSPEKTVLTGAKLADVAHEMPAVFRNSSITWTELRHETHARKDGADVGLIYGDAKRDNDGVTFRTLQIAFPDDTGTTIVTASYGPEDIATIEPKILASTDDASGVAIRRPRSPGWIYMAWGVGAFVVVYFVSSLLERKKPVNPEPAANSFRRAREERKKKEAGLRSIESAPRDEKDGTKSDEEDA